MWRNRCNIFEVQNELKQGLDADNFNVREKLGFGEIVGRNVDFGKAGRFGGFDNIDDAANGADLPVQGEFTGEEFLVKIGIEEITREYEDS